MKKIKLTCAHAIVKFLTSQKILIDGKKEPLFAGAFGIFGHGNVACLGQALEENKDKLPTYRGHHEQNMALTGIAYARAKRRKQVFVATSSVGPGSTNMVTAAAVAMSNRLPILFLPGDTSLEQQLRDLVNSKHGDAVRCLGDDNAGQVLASLDGIDHHDWLTGLAHALELTVLQVVKKLFPLWLEDGGNAESAEKFCGKLREIKGNN